MEKKITFDRFIRGSIACGLIIILLLLIKRLSGVLLPFFIAWLIAYLMYPLVKLFQYRLRFKNRILSILAAMLCITALIVGFSLFVIPPIIEEFTRVCSLMIDFFSNGIQNKGNIPEAITNYINNNDELLKWGDYLSKEKLIAIAKDTLPKVWLVVSESIGFLMKLFVPFIILLYVIFILLDYESIAEGWIHLLPEKYRPFTIRLVSDVETAMNTYFRGQALVALCVGILFSIGFLIIDFPMAIGLGLFIGALNLVPYLQVVGFLPTVILAILKAADTGQNFWFILLAALAVFAIVQTIQDTVIVPKIMGKITGLNPAIILLSLSIWGSLLGMVGMIIALPLTTLMLSYYRRFVIHRETIYQKEKEKTLLQLNLDDNKEEEKIKRNEKN